MNDSPNGADAAPQGASGENSYAGPVRVGLALSGGATKAVAHVGVIKALVEDGVAIESITATSGGAIVGALYASGMSVEELEHIAVSMSWKSMAQLSLSRVGFLSSEQIERFLVATIGDRTFNQMELPFAVIATNLVAGTRHVFREGRVALAVRASCSIPQIYHPVEIDGQFYVDGGLV
jgi:NTE family protein